MLVGPRIMSASAAPAAGGNGSAPRLVVSGLKPIFVSAGSADTWSNGFVWVAADGSALGPFSGPSAAACSAATGLCSANLTGDGTKFWGFVQADIDWQALTGLVDMGALNGASGTPYIWSLTQSSPWLGTAPLLAAASTCWQSPCAGATALDPTAGAPSRVRIGTGTYLRAL